MMLQVNTTPRTLADRLSELIGKRVKLSFGREPSYTVGPFLIDSAGFLRWDGEAGLDRVTEKQLREGLAVPPGTPTAAPQKKSAAPRLRVENVVIRLPLEGHTARSLRNLLYLFYSSGELIAKAAGGTLAVEPELVDCLRHLSPARSSRSALTELLRRYEAERGKPGLSGVHLEPEALVIDGLGPLKNERHRESWERFFQALDRMAKTQKRVIPEKPCSDNEKYLFFTLLQRAGMKGEAYKADRKRLMERLSGQSGVKELC